MVLAADVVEAQADSVATRPAQAEAAVPVSPVSPRSALEQYLNLARAGRYREAAAYLDLPDADRAGALGALRARQFKAVLDRYLWIDLESVSPLGGGDGSDGLSGTVDQIGTVRGADGVAVPIRMVRNFGNEEVPWRFTRATSSQIQTLYQTLPGRWALDHLPAALLRPGPFELLRWQWAALPLLLALAALLGTLASRVLRGIFTRVTQRTQGPWDDAVGARLAGPLTAALTLVAASFLIQQISLYPPALQASQRLLRSGFFLIFFWSLARLVDVVRQILSQSRWARSAPSSAALLPLGARVAKVVVFAIAVVAILALLNYPVASLIAGLGLGGLALALAAQKTVENLFGAFSIGIDQPIREGDFVKIEDFVGTVEAIGLRSTRFRTLDRTIISIPNGRLADMRLESFTARDRMRLATVIRLEHQTDSARVRQVLSGLEAVLRAHPKIWPDAVVVRFRELALSSLDIEIMAWFQTPDWGEFQLIRQDILLQFMAVLERAGVALAYPTQTLHVAGAAPLFEEWHGARAAAPERAS